MANRRIEVHQYREVLYRIRQGETLRAIDRAKLMSRRKSKVFVEMVQSLGWLDPCVELPDNATIAKALLDHKEQAKIGPVGRRTSLGPEHQALIRQWVECGVNGVVIHQNLQKNYGVNCHYSSIRRLVRKIKVSTHQTLATTPS